MSEKNGLGLFGFIDYLVGGFEGNVIYNWIFERVFGAFMKLVIVISFIMLVPITYYSIMNKETGFLISVGISVTVTLLATVSMILKYAYEESQYYKERRVKRKSYKTGILEYKRNSISNVVTTLSIVSVIGVVVYNYLSIGKGVEDFVQYFETFEFNVYWLIPIIVLGLIFPLITNMIYETERLTKEIAGYLMQNKYVYEETNPKIKEVADRYDIEIDTLLYEGLSTIFHTTPDNVGGMYKFLDEFNGVEVSKPSRITSVIRGKGYKNLTLKGWYTLGYYGHPDINKNIKYEELKEGQWVSIHEIPVVRNYNRQGLWGRRKECKGDREIRANFTEMYKGRDKELKESIEWKDDNVSVVLVYRKNELSKVGIMSSQLQIEDKLENQSKGSKRFVKTMMEDDKLISELEYYIDNS